MNRWGCTLPPAPVRPPPLQCWYKEPQTIGFLAGLHGTVVHRIVGEGVLCEAPRVRAGIAIREGRNA